MTHQPQISRNAQLFKPIVLIGLICFVLFKAIMPAGFMVTPDTGMGFGLCHGDAKSAALMSHLQGESALVKQSESLLQKQGDHVFEPTHTADASQHNSHSSQHNFHSSQHKPNASQHKPNASHATALLCGYAALQLLVFGLIGLLALLFTRFLPLLFGYQPVASVFNLYVLALSRAPPI